MMRDNKIQEIDISSLKRGNLGPWPGIFDHYGTIACRPAVCVISSPRQTPQSIHRLQPWSRKYNATCLEDVLK